MIKKLWDGFTSLMVILVVSLAILLVGVRLLGLNVFTVLSGSMEPSLHVGALVYVKETPPEKLRTGDVITFLAGESVVVTHRVAGVVPDESDPNILYFRTKGDANNTEDANLVHPRNVIGKVVLTIPWLGYLSHYVQSPPGMYVALGVGSVLLLLAFLPIGGETKPKRKKGKYEA